jgi:hypothetical protein
MSRVTAGTRDSPLLGSRGGKLQLVGAAQRTVCGPDTRRSLAKVQVLYDKSGNILSVGVPAPRTDDFRGPAFGVQPEERQQAADLEVPPDLANIALHEFLQKLKVDVTKRRLVAK